MGISSTNSLNEPSHSPTMEPTYSPTFTPTDTPTGSPTRYPTTNKPFISFISINFKLDNYTQILLTNIYNNVYLYTSLINFAIEKSLFNSFKDRYPDEPITYNDFEVDILKLNDIEINDDALINYIPYNDTFYLTTQIACNRDDESLVCRLILSILQTHTELFLDTVNDQIRIILSDKNIIISVNESELNDLEIKKFETKKGLPSLFMVLALIVTVCMLIFCWALYGNNMCKRCCGRGPDTNTRQNTNNNIVYSGVHTRSDVSSNIDSNYPDEQKGFL